VFLVFFEHSAPRLVEACTQTSISFRKDFLQERQEYFFFVSADIGGNLENLYHSITPFYM